MFSIWNKKQQSSLFLIWKYLYKYVAVFKNIDFLKNDSVLSKKIFFLVKKSWKMPCDSNNFQHIGKILSTSVDNLVSQIPLKKFWENRI